MKIALVAIDAQYFHTNLAVRSIAAYTQKQAGIAPQILEFTINQRAELLLEKIYKAKPDAIVFSCYIWNIEMVCALAAELQKLLPNTFLAAGGPQVSYHCEEFLRGNPAFTAVLAGEGETSTLALFKALQKGDGLAKVPGLVLRQGGKIITTPKPMPLPLDEIPFAYSETDLAAGRILYYESMRGCPFGCSYCLSSVERGVRFKTPALVYQDLARFLAAAPKQVKFVDRTFNCNKAHAMGIWQFLKENDNGVTNFHFELAGELLDDETIAFLGTVRPGLFQFEIGVQSTNTKTLAEIDRPANLQQLFANIAKLQQPQNIHLHLDLIAGLPYEGFDSFVQSFNTVYGMVPNQFQLGFLKVLAGSGMEQNAQKYGLVWQNAAPFEVLYTKWLNFDELLVLKWVAQMVEVYYNSGRFAHLVRYLCGQFASPFVFYNKLAQFYLASGADNAPLSKVGYYQLLGNFMQNQGLPLTEKAQWLCRLDLALHEKTKALPAFVTVDETRARREEILAFYQKEENLQTYLPEYAAYPPKQILKMAHIEVLPFNPVTGEENPCALLFNYKQRDIEGRAKMWEIEL
ncbi:B12-binding domain-containing radical SAM protein [Ruminococcaceae bacterium OttesenSCG-928-A16]|nr:B12-binding domain-containing radical SAM protein [Ruminococcaceae bacterium OttesenSCG-928-A16]